MDSSSVALLAQRGLDWRTFMGGMTTRSRSRAQAICVLLLLAAMGILPGAASAKRHSSGISVSVGWSRQLLAVHISTHAGAKCSLKVSARGRSAMFSVWKVGRTGSATIKWEVPRDAPSGIWTFVASCVKGKHRVTSRKRVRLINRGSGKGQLVSAPAPYGGKGGGQQSCAPVTVGGPPSTVCFINDPFATAAYGDNTGQCTWYAAGMRPDLDGFERYDASSWLTDAQGRVPTGTVPVVGSIAVNTTADGGLGHVAYVAGVQNNGATLILDEANADNHGNVWLNVGTPAADFQGYIYGGPAGNGPGPGGSSPPGGGPTGTTGAPPANGAVLGTSGVFVDANGNYNVFVTTSGGLNHYEKSPSGSWGGEVVATGSFTSAPGAFYESPDVSVGRVTAVVVGTGQRA